MKRAFSKLVAIVAVLGALAVAISVTTSELWLGVWFVLFIYFGIPVLLLSIADLLRSVRGASEKKSVFSTVIHVTAVFAFLVGFLVYKLAEWSDHPMVDKHAYIPLIFVAIVYGVPLSLWIRDRVTELLFRTVTTEEALHDVQSNHPIRGPEQGD